ncbi:hypothetical protein KM043_017534 [Ampulex compressa]|nr:hypothetical protein KM043_017534 [Ampulex compressa]
MMEQKKRLKTIQGERLMLNKKRTSLDVFADKELELLQSGAQTVFFYVEIVEDIFMEIPKRLKIKETVKESVHDQTECARKEFETLNKGNRWEVTIGESTQKASMPPQRRMSRLPDPADQAVALVPANVRRLHKATERARQADTLRSPA